jgi:hypothetical protein
MPARSSTDLLAHALSQGKIKRKNLEDVCMGLTGLGGIIDSLDSFDSRELKGGWGEWREGS